MYYSFHFTIFRERRKKAFIRDKVKLINIGRNINIPIYIRNIRKISYLPVLRRISVPSKPFGYRRLKIKQL